ncbi:hypothetical protein JX265_005436 [Neoarthrinium moseri]|uniref:Uncharacterized protein n=1 Tax=Neoarthrinium moseri TaxID=1658444 RepID=A0A9Q0AQ48_9PEZI|nr:hypothetical protein JX265_005436 [Neoarthrinium moseri]
MAIVEVELELPVDAAAAVGSTVGVDIGCVDCGVVDQAVVSAAADWLGPDENVTVDIEDEDVVVAATSPIVVRAVGVPTGLSIEKKHKRV